MNWYWYVIIFLVVFIAGLIWLISWLWREKWSLEDEVVNLEHSSALDRSKLLSEQVERDRANRTVELLLNEIPEPSRNGTKKTTRKTKEKS